MSHSRVGQVAESFEDTRFHYLWTTVCESDGWLAIDTPLWALYRVISRLTLWHIPSAIDLAQVIAVVSCKERGQYWEGTGSSNITTYVRTNPIEE